MKFVANHLVAIHNVAAAEAMVLAMKAGLDPRQTVEVIASGAGTSRVFELRAPMMAASTYLPATARGTMFEKDIAVIGDFAADLRCPTPLFDLAASMCTAALAMGHGAEDIAAMCEVYAQMAGLERKSARSRPDPDAAAPAAVQDRHQPADDSYPIASLSAGSTFSAISTMERRPRSRSSQSLPA